MKSFMIFLLGFFATPFFVWLAGNDICVREPRVVFLVIVSLFIGAVSVLYYKVIAGHFD